MRRTKTIHNSSLRFQTNYQKQSTNINETLLLEIQGRFMKGRVQTTWTNEGGEGVAQMTTTLNNSYLEKVSTWGEGFKIAQNSVHVVCTQPQ